MADEHQQEQLDPYAMPLTVALGMQVVCTGLILYWRFVARPSKEKMTPQEELIFHGLWMLIVALLAGVLIPHVPRKRSMLSFHGVGCLQAAVLIGLGAIWPYAYPQKGTGHVAAWCNILGKWINCVGFTYSALTGAQCLLYWTKHENPSIHAVGSAAETVLEITLKTQGTLDVVGAMITTRAYLMNMHASNKDKTK